MTNHNYLAAIILLSTILILPSAFASSDSNNRHDNYKQHYAKRHQMDMEMMHMLSETMTILRDLNHKPSTEEKANLNKMIDQMDAMMRSHKKMVDYYKKDNDRNDYYRRDSDMNKHHDRMMNER